MTESPCTLSPKVVHTNAATKPVLLASYWLALEAEGTNSFFDIPTKRSLSVRHLSQVGVALARSRNINIYAHTDNPVSLPRNYIFTGDNKAAM